VRLEGNYEGYRNSWEINYCEVMNQQGRGDRVYGPGGGTDNYKKIETHGELILVQ